MNITFENPDKINGLMTVTVEESDYKDKVAKTLKDYRKRANIPGFRPGMVPMSMIERQFGLEVKAETLNQVVGEMVSNYIKENKIVMLGQPLRSEGQEELKLEEPAPYTFRFDIAIAPEFKIELNKDSEIDYYQIKVDDSLIDKQVEMLSSQMGSYKKEETYQDGDMLKGELRESDEKGNTKEGGVTVENAVLMPSYIKVDDQKKHFEGAKVGDTITFNPRKAYPDNDTEVSSLLKIDRDKIKEHEGDFSFQISEVNRFTKHPVDQELFDNVFGKNNIKDEKEFRNKIAEGLKKQLEQDSDFKFLQDVRAYCEKEVGKLKFPEELLKRMMKENYKDKGEDFVEKNFEKSIQELAWHLIKEQLVSAHKVQIDENDINDIAAKTAQAQFSQYGMNNIPQEYITNYANELLKKKENADMFADRAIEAKLGQKLKETVKLNMIPISLDDFNKILEDK